MSYKSIENQSHKTSPIMASTHDEINEMNATNQPNEISIGDLSISDDSDRRDILESSSILNEMMRDKSEKQSIFRKADERDATPSMTSSARSRETYTILNSKDLANSIPMSATTKCIQPLPSNYVEWRWRFFKIGDRKMVEVSHFDGNKRIFTDYNGNRIEYDMTNEWDKYVVRTLYAYARTNESS